MRYNKLVRDNTINILKEKGFSVKYHIADKEEYSEKLKEKLQEEVTEYFENENLEELADIIEVVYTICIYKKISIIELENIRKKKLLEKGGFLEKIILDYVKE